ncbi:MAG: NAD-dependent epimerase/dehydratase family protein [Pseudomonadota bacterium]|nr:NAD-dependent epimerase/dehydratase family protein [Pseudomonadota bacterium]
MSSDTILVTGAAGFIGFHLTRRLLADGFRVVGLDNLEPYYDVGLKKMRLDALCAEANFAFHDLDLCHHGAVLALSEATRPAFVVHLAAQAGVRYSIEAPHAYQRANIDGFLSVLEACRHHPPRHVLYASSSSVYGANRKVPFAETDPVDLPVSFYAATKRSNEMMARSYAHLYRLPLSGLRFFTVYGTHGRPDMAYWSFTEAILKGEPVTLFNEGRMRRDFTHVSEVVSGIAGLLAHPPGEGRSPADEGGAPHRLYNLGNNDPVELSRFVTAIERAAGRPAEIRYQPMPAGDVIETYADISRLANLTGFRPAISIEDGMAEFVAWYRAYRSLN